MKTDASNLPRNAPTCQVCGRSTGVEFSITPRFPPFGTCCRGCEARTPLNATLAEIRAGLLDDVDRLIEGARAISDEVAPMREYTFQAPAECWFVVRARSIDEATSLADRIAARVTSWDDPTSGTVTLGTTEYVLDYWPRFGSGPVCTWRQGFP